MLIAVGLLGVSVLGLWLVGRNLRRPRFVWCLVASWLLVSLAGDLYVAPGLNVLKSPRPFSERAKPYIELADRTDLLAYNMAGVYNLYTELTAAPVLPRSREALTVMSGPHRVAVIARQHVRREVFGEPCPYPVPVSAKVGATIMELIVNWDPLTGKTILAPQGASPGEG